MTATPLSAEVVSDLLGRSRWFGAKGRAFTVEDVTTVPLAAGPDPAVDVALVRLGFPGEAGERHEVYQLPLATYAEAQDRLHHALVTVTEAGDHVYDAVHDREAMAAWLAAFDAPPAGTPVRFHRLGDHHLDPDTHSTLFSGEQSNSTVVFGSDALMKVFRRVTPGLNPDIEIQRVISEAASTSVAELYGWVELPAENDGADGAEGAEPMQLAMLQQYLVTASDGWDLALASVRNLVAEADLRADEVGGDFAGEAHRLGRTVREVHGLMADAFGEGTRSAADLAAAMDDRLDAAVGAVPALEQSAGAARAVFARLRDLGELPVQRVHGDLHLGQTLRTSIGWKLVDFEGEPAKPLAERRLPDSPWRDVAGMLRSFDYASQTVARDVGATGDAGAQIAYRVREWRRRNRDAFLAGYQAERAAPLAAQPRSDHGPAQPPQPVDPTVADTPLDDTERTLIAAYEADKAVYEVVYEARNRPEWIDIPLSALSRLADQNGGSR